MKDTDNSSASSNSDSDSDMDNNEDSTKVTNVLGKLMGQEKTKETSGIQELSEK